MEQLSESRKKALKDLEKKIAEIEKQMPKDGTLITFLWFLTWLYWILVGVEQVVEEVELKKVEIADIEKSIRSGSLFKPSYCWS